jgi:hypothetical protein
MTTLDWESTPLGPPESWPDELHRTVRLMGTFKQQIALYQGPQFAVPVQIGVLAAVLWLGLEQPSLSGDSSDYPGFCPPRGVACAFRAHNSVGASAQVAGVVMTAMADVLSNWTAPVSSCRKSSRPGLWPTRTTVDAVLGSSRVTARRSSAEAS